MSLGQRLIGWAITFAILGGAGYVFREPLRGLAIQTYSDFFPCTRPVTYRIGTVDEKFGYSREKYVQVIEQAAAIWETGGARELFAYDQEKGEVEINLIYDYRQEAIDKLRSIGISIDGDQATYDSLRAKYDALQVDFQRRKSALNTQVQSFQQQQDAYNATVQQWNAKGGAPKAEFERLEREKASLYAARGQLQAEQEKLNSMVDSINAMATTLNKLAHSLNIQVDHYNTVGASTGEEFEEGVYEFKYGKAKIDIFEFSDQGELRRVLAHELGHALGLEHVEDSEALMYRLNQSSRDTLTPDDLRELERVCGAKSS